MMPEAFPARSHAHLMAPAMARVSSQPLPLGSRQDTSLSAPHISRRKSAMNLHQPMPPSLHHASSAPALLHTAPVHHHLHSAPSYFHPPPNPYYHPAPEYYPSSHAIIHPPPTSLAPHRIIHPPPTASSSRPIATLPSRRRNVTYAAGSAKPPKSPKRRTVTNPAATGELTFINFSSADSEKLLSGVAPSGSQSKRKREEAAKAAATATGEEEPRERKRSKSVEEVDVS